MKISVIFNIILAVIIAVLCFAKHVTIVNTLPKETPAVAPVEATGDSSWMWTDFSHPDTVDYTDSILEKMYTTYGSYRYNVRSYYLTVVYSYHGNGIPALSYHEELNTDHRNAKDDFIDKRMVYRTPGGNIKAAYNFKKKRWFCVVGFDAYYNVSIEAFREYDSAIYLGLVTKNPESCPEQTREHRVHNRITKEN